jgi:hypothetical protein
MRLQNVSQGFRDKQFCLQERGPSALHTFCDIPAGKFTDIDESNSMLFENADRP